MFFNTEQFDHEKDHLFFFITFEMIHSILGSRVVKKATEIFISLFLNPSNKIQCFFNYIDIWKLQSAILAESPPFG